MNTRWAWRKSSRSATNGACVEIGTRPGVLLAAVRDSKAGTGAPILTFSPAELGTFLDTIKHHRA
jgi:hypothetical protein